MGDARLGWSGMLLTSRIGAAWLENTLVLLLALIPSPRPPPRWGQNFAELSRRWHQCSHLQTLHLFSGEAEGMFMAMSF